MRAARSTDWIVAAAGGFVDAIRHCRIGFGTVDWAPRSVQATGGCELVGIVVVSHSADLARGVAELASQMAGPGGADRGRRRGTRRMLGTDDALVRDAIRRADQGDGVAVLGDLGSAILTIRHVLERQSNGHARLVDAPLVEGAVAAAVMASTGCASPTWSRRPRRRARCNQALTSAARAEVDAARRRRSPRAPRRRLRARGHAVLRERVGGRRRARGRTPRACSSILALVPGAAPPAATRRGRRRDGAPSRRSRRDQALRE